MNPPLATMAPVDPSETAGDSAATPGVRPGRRARIEDETAPGAAPPSRIGRELRLWLLSLALFAPILVPYAAHFAFQSPGRLPTGFIDYDLPYYLANAREHFDSGQFHFFYSNPFDPNYAAPRIYVQPMSLALGTLMHVTGLGPNVAWMIFHLLAGWICARVAIALYEEVVGLETWPRRLGLLAFFWGGGLIVLAGIPYSLAKTGQIQQLFILDPFDGWWCLNFGRNLIYAHESLYHALFLGCILAVLRRRLGLATFLALFMAWSHPFTGVELLLILAAWSALELFFVRSGEVPVAFFGAMLALLGLHLGYYIGYLRRFPEHQKLMDHWSLSWLYQLSNFVPADALVGALAFWSFRRLDLARIFFAESRNRLFLVWFLVAFGLANHEFAIKPMQPLHFTRGYDWTPLFFMGATTLTGLFSTLRSRTGPVLGRLAVGAVLAIFLLDNAVWLGSFAWEGARGKPWPYWTVTADQLALYRWMNEPENRGALLLTSDVHDVPYLAAAYTPLRPWYGHVFNTPDLHERRREVAAFLKDGRVIDAWRGNTLLVTLNRDVPEPAWLAKAGARPVYENPSFHVYRWAPPPKSPGRSL